MRWIGKLGRATKGGKIISRQDIQRLSDEELRPPPPPPPPLKNFLVILTSFETRGGIRTGVFLELEIVVRARNLHEAFAIGYNRIASKLGKHWGMLEALDWHEGISHTDAEPSDRVIFRKFRADGSEYYGKSYK